MGTSLQAALQEHANGLVFLLVVLSSIKKVILLLHIIEGGSNICVHRRTNGIRVSSRPFGRLIDMYLMK